MKSNGDQVDLDAVIMATGFDILKGLTCFEVVGNNNLKLHDIWGNHPKAFLAATYPGEICKLFN